MDKIAFDLTLNTADTANSIKDIKTSLKDLKTAALSFGEGSDEFLKATQKAGQLQDKLNDVNDTIRVLSGNSVENFNRSFTNLASTAVGAFGAIEGAQALFGTESEELQRTLVKLQGLMNLSNGIREFANIGQAAKDFKVVLASLIPTIFTETTATEGAAVAQTGLNAAMRANPIATVFAALTLLVGAIVLFTNKTDDATESQELNTEQIEKAKKEEEDYKKSIDDTNLSLDDRIRKLDDELAVLGKNGAEKDRILTQQDAENRKRELLTDKNTKDGLAALERLEELRLKGYLKTTAEFIELKELESSELVRIGLKAQEDLSKIEQLKTGKISEINKQASEDAQKRAKENNDKKLKAEQDLIKAVEAEYNAENEKDVKRGEAELDRIKKENAEKLRLEQELNDANRELTKQINDDADKDIKVISELKLARNAEDSATRIQYLKEQRDIELQNTELTVNERLLIEQRTANEIKKIEEDTFNSRLNAVQNGFASIANLAQQFGSQSKKQQEVAFKIQKGAAIGSAIIDTYKAANAAYASLAGIPVVGPVLGGVAAGVAVAAGLLNVKQIKEQKFDAGGSGASPAISTPSFGGGSGVNSSQNTVSNGQFLNVGDFKPGEDSERRVYVVESDITGVQKRVQVIENRSIY
jgi:hypothetical protein